MIHLFQTKDHTSKRHIDPVRGVHQGLESTYTGSSDKSPRLGAGKEHSAFKKSHCQLQKEEKKKIFMGVQDHDLLGALVNVQHGCTRHFREGVEAQTHTHTQNFVFKCFLVLPYNINSVSSLSSPVQQCEPAVRFWPIRQLRNVRSG